MYYSSTVLALIGLALAQRPTNTSICDYYTTALLKENNATNQMTLLTLVVNTAVIGNYTKPNVGIAVPGILTKGQYNGTDVDLLPYFSGGLLSSNRGGKIGVSVNFLDDGGAAPLKLNKPSNGTTSAQYKLLTHLYEYFGVLLGCSEVGKTGYPAYSGHTSMGAVHRFMNLDAAQIGYFITQVGLSAASFGVATDDVTAVGMSLNKAFGYKCSPPNVISPLINSTAEIQAICQASDCPLSPNATCAAYGNIFEPATATSSATATGSSVAGATGSATSTGSGGSGGSTATSNIAAPDYQASGSVVGVILGAIAFAIAL